MIDLKISIKILKFISKGLLTILVFMELAKILKIVIKNNSLNFYYNIMIDKIN